MNCFVYLASLLAHWSNDYIAVLLYYPITGSLQDQQRMSHSLYRRKTYDSSSVHKPNVDMHHSTWVLFTLPASLQIRSSSSFDPTYTWPYWRKTCNWCSNSWNDIFFHLQLFPASEYCNNVVTNKIHIFCCKYYTSVLLYLSLGRKVIVEAANKSRQVTIS